LACCYICRFYQGYRLEHIRGLTISQFNILLEQAGEITKMESGEGEKQKPTEEQRKQSARAARIMFGKK